MPRLRTLVNSRPKARSVAGVFATMRYTRPMPHRAPHRRSLRFRLAASIVGLGTALAAAIGAAATASAADDAAVATTDSAMAVPPPVDPRIYDIVESVSADRIEADVRRLAGFGTRNTLSDTESDTRGVGAARRSIKAEYERISEACRGCLEVALHATPRRAQRGAGDYSDRLLAAERHDSGRLQATRRPAGVDTEERRRGTHRRPSRASRSRPGRSTCGRLA